MAKHYTKESIRKKNQKFISIPFGKLRNRISYLCKLHGIEFILQEESYTSKASFYDMDEIPVYKENETKNYIFSGKRIKRGLYIRNNKEVINADLNGALNILRKSSVCEKEILTLSRRGVSTPLRLQVM